MIVISDTGPLRYLLEIEELDLLQKLFASVAVPPAVIDELRHLGAPALIRDRLRLLPSWLVVRAPASRIVAPSLHPGEIEAIALALELKANLVLIDDRDASAFARRSGLATFGTLGVLDLAASLGLTSFPEALARLERTNFRRSPELWRQLLEKDRLRQSNPPASPPTN